MLAMEVLLFGLIGILDNLTVPILKKIVVKLDLEITLVTSGMMLVVNGSLVLFVREKELPPHLTLPHNTHLQKEVIKFRLDLSPFNVSGLGQVASDFCKHLQ